MKSCEALGKILSAEVIQVGSREKIDRLHPNRRPSLVQGTGCAAVTALAAENAVALGDQLFHR